MAQADRPLNSPLQVPISRDPPPGVDPALIGVFDDIFNALYQLQIALVNYAGIAPQDQQFWNQLTPDQTILQQNMNRIYLKADEDLLFGNMCHLFLTGGELRARLADATDNTRWCSAYCNTAAGVNTGSYGEFIIAQGLCAGIGGIVAGPDISYLKLREALLRGHQSEQERFHK